MRRQASLVIAVALEACTQRVATGDETGPDGDVLEPNAPAALAKAECAPLFECECESSEDSDEGDCIDARTAEYEEMAQAARSEGLAYDGACVAAIVAWHAEVGCALQSTFVFPAPERPLCHPYALPDAESKVACTLPAAFGGSFATPCLGGELCIDGRCSPPWWLVGAEIGERCPSAEACRYPGTCIDEECAPRLPAGSDCGFDVLVPCDPSTYCDGNTCLPKLGPGAPCESEGFDSGCSTLACAQGVCADAPLQCGGV